MYMVGLKNPEADEDLIIKDPAHLDAFGQRLKIALWGGVERTV